MVWNMNQTMAQVMAETLQSLQRTSNANYVRQQSNRATTTTETISLDMPVSNYDLPPSYEHPPSYEEAKLIKKYYSNTH